MMMTQICIMPHVHLPVCYQKQQQHRDMIGCSAYVTCNPQNIHVCVGACDAWMGVYVLVLQLCMPMDGRCMRLRKSLNTSSPRHIHTPTLRTFSVISLTVAQQFPCLYLMEHVQGVPTFLRGAATVKCDGKGSVVTVCRMEPDSDWQVGGGE